MNAQDWHVAFLQSLEEASNLERQRRAWIGGMEPAFPTPTELICQIFDDSGVNDLLSEGIVFSESTDALIKKLSLLTGHLNLMSGPAALLSSEDWIRFARQAA